MENFKKPDRNTFLNVDFTNDNTIWLTNSLTLRKIIGILGMAMPLLLFGFLYLDNGLEYPLDSISHYYYTRVSSVFVIILTLLAIFLIVYKGKDPADFYISLLAGIFAFLVILFPTTNLSQKCCDPNIKYAVTYLEPDTFRKNLHYTAAALFFICLSVMSLFIFTKSDKTPKKRGLKKKIRNRIYRTCGVLILLSLFIIFAAHKDIIPSSFYGNFPLTFWMEALAIESFGFSWLIKGETLFKD